MEELLIVLVQFVFELAVQVLAEFPWDLLLSSSPHRFEQRSGPWVFLSLFAGGALGGLSLLIFPNTLIRWGGLRMANMIVAPAFSALCSLAVLNARGRNRLSRGRHVACAACFTFALALIRFAYAHRA